MFTRLGRPLEFLTSLDRVDHRMHNKTFVVDNQAAVIGGRNIGDDYFGVSHEYNFRDFDLLALGPRAAAQCSACFDAYWADCPVLPGARCGPAPVHRRGSAQGAAPGSTPTSKRTVATFPYRLPTSRGEALRYVTRRDPLGRAGRRPRCCTTTRARGRSTRSSRRTSARSCSAPRRRARCSW